jgi:hypothetical protein
MVFVVVVTVLIVEVAMIVGVPGAIATVAILVVIVPASAAAAVARGQRQGQHPTTDENGAQWVHHSAVSLEGSGCAKLCKARTGLAEIAT